jgi:probable lipoprotein (TIGR04455 family)
MRFWMLAAVALTGCSVVKHVTVRDDWAREDAPRVRRLAVVVQPLPDGQAKAGELFARIARRYVNQKREFLVKKELVDAAPVPLAGLCGGDDAIEGVLQLNVGLKRVGTGFEATLDGVLLRCPDGREEWKVNAAGSFASADEHLREVTASYSREVGPEVEPYVAPAMNLLRPALDTLPNPFLTDADREEKMGLD